MRLPEPFSLLLLALAALLTACQTPPAPPPPTVAECPAPAEPAPPAADPLQAMLAYAAELRARPAAETVPVEVVGVDVAQTMRKALVLSQSRSATELAQAAAQLELVAASVGPQAEALKPLAALLAPRVAEQRRLVEGMDRLAQQLRDAQRRNDQLNEKLEALKAIEQKLPAGGAGR